MDFSGISNFGWAAITMLGLSIIVSMCVLLRTRNVKTKFFEVSQKEHESVKKEHESVKKELAMSEGKDQLDNQCQVAKQILKELRIRLYETALRIFEFKSEQEKVIMELITYRIVDRLNYDVKNDLTRNHILRKSDYEMELYSRAKARGYFSMISDRLYQNNRYLPGQNLPDIMKQLPLLEIEILFKDVYFSARRIAGGQIIEKAKEEKDGQGY